MNDMMDALASRAIEVAVYDATNTTKRVRG